MRKFGEKNQAKRSTILNALHLFVENKLYYILHI